MNKNKILEYILVVIINVFFAFYTNLFLGGIPYISLQIVTEKTYLSIIGWFLYGGLLYMILKWDNIHIKGKFRFILGAVAVGLVTVLLKAVLDYSTSTLIADRISLIMTVVIEGIIYDIFGIGLILFIFILFVKRKRHWSKQSNKPFIWIMVDVVVYIIGLIRIFTGSSNMMKLIGTSEENIRKIDLYYAHVALPLNVWTYTFLMIFFWWLMRTLYNEEEENQTVDEEKPNE